MKSNSEFHLGIAVELEGAWLIKHGATCSPGDNPCWERHKRRFLQQYNSDKARMARGGRKPPATAFDRGSVQRKRQRIRVLIDERQRLMARNVPDRAPRMIKLTRLIARLSQELADQTLFVG